CRSGGRHFGSFSQRHASGGRDADGGRGYEDVAPSVFEVTLERGDAVGRGQLAPGECARHRCRGDAQDEGPRPGGGQVAESLRQQLSDAPVLLAGSSLPSTRATVRSHISATWGS